MRRLLPLVAVVTIAGAALPSSGGAATPTPAPTPAATPSLTGPLDPLAQQLADALARQQALDAVKASLAAEASAAKDEQSQLTQLVLANRHQIAQTEKGIATQQAALADASSRAAAAQDEASREHAEAVADRDLLTATLRSEYEGGTDSLMSYVLSSGSFSDLITRLSQASQLNSGVDRIAAHLANAERRATAAAAEARRQEEAARTAAALLQQQQQTLQQQVTDQQTLIDRLGAQAAGALRDIAGIDGKTAALAQQIADLRIGQLDKTISDAEQAAWDQAQYYVQQHLTGLPSVLAPGANGDLAALLSAAHGALPAGLINGTTVLVWPAPGTSIAQGFGPSPYTFEPPAFGLPHFHTGIDLAGPMGTPIYAAAAGVVATAASGSTGYGNHIVIALDGRLLTLYGHLEAMVVHPGDVVHQGQLIGLMGSTGNSTGPHLHFEVRLANVPVNPAALLPALPRGASGPPPLPH